MRSEIMLKDFKPNHTDVVTQLNLLTESACKGVLLAVLLCSLLSFVPISSAQKLGAEDDSVIAKVRSSEQLLNDFVNGRELADNALSNSLPNSLSNSLPHSRSSLQAKADGSIQQTLSGSSTAANLVAAQLELLTEFENIVGQPKGFLARVGSAFDQLPEIQNLAPKFKQWQAQHLLYLENFNLTEQKLSEINASSKHLDRLSNTKSSYQSRAEPLLADIEDLLLAHETSSSVSFLKRAGLQQDLHSMSLRLNQLVNQSTQEQPILRFSNLPYQALALPQKDIVLEPAITPSYAQAMVVEPTIEDSEVGAIEPAVQALAEELGYDPIQLYQYVHSQIETRWYAGSMLSAGSVIEQGEGNSTDQALLLSELMRASSIPTRFVTGVVRVPSEKLLDMTAVDGLNQALAVLQRAGVPYRTVVEGGRIRAILIQQTWLSVYVPYTNYRGASLDRSGQVWLALMPSVKAWTRDESGTLLRDSGFNANTLRESFLQTVQSQDVVEQVKTQLADAVLNQPQGSEPGNQLDTTTLIIQNAGYLPNTLPFSVEAVLSENAVLAKSLSHQVRFIAYRDANQSLPIMDVTIPVSELANKSLSLSYQAGSQDDHDLILSFGGLGLTPLYLVDLRAQIKVNGVPVAVSEEILPAGILHKFSIGFNGPAGSYRVDKVVRSGNYHGIGITAQDARYRESEENFETSGGRILSQIALRYLSDWSEAERALSQLLKRRIVQPLPNLVFASNDIAVNVEAVLGQPISFDFLGVNLDAALRVTESLAARPDAFSERDFATLSALQGSYLEHAIFERLFGVESISADKGLALAVGSGNHVLALNTASLSDLELTLGLHSASVTKAVRDWLQLGFDVLIPAEPLTYLEWSGSVWVVTDPLTGEAGYFISRGLAGGATAEPFPGDIGGLLADPTSQGTNFDSSQATSITLFNNSNFQTVAAGQEYEALAVHVRDNQGLAVAGAEVIFDHSVSIGEFVADDGVILGANGSASVVTDLQGVARVTYRAPEIILDSPDISFLVEDNGDTIPSRVAINYIEVRVEPTGQAALRAEQFFTLLTLPGDPVELFHDLETGTGLVGIDNAEIGFDEIYVRDEFGNTVSNIDVLVKTEAVRPEGVPDGLPENKLSITPHRISTPDCDKLAFSFTNCGSTSITYKSNSLGFVSVGVILGEVEADLRGVTELGAIATRLRAEYPLNISIDEDIQIELAYQVSDFVAVFNGLGPSRFSAVNVGGTYRGSGFESANPSIGRIVQGEPRIERMEALNVTMQLEDFEGEATFTNITPSSFSGGADIEYTNMVVGDKPGYYAPVISWSYLGDPAQGEGELLRRSQATLQRVAAVRITPTNPNSLELAKDLLPQRFEPLKYAHEPADYRPTYEVLEVFEDGEVIASVIGKNGEVSIPPIPLDPAKEYHAEVVYNQGSEFDEVRSNRFELPVTAPVIFRAGAETQNERAGRVSRGGGGGGSIIIDRVNGQTCNVVEPTFSLDLVQEAKVTIETFHPNFSSRVQFITRKTLDAGLTEFDRSDIFFDKAFSQEGVTRVFITAESTKTGRIDTLESRFSFSETNINVLPVGSPTYENVNLWNGSLFFSKTDLHVPDRGPNLEFSRHYSSQNRSASSLGPGWSHNYDSFVQITPCGWVAVSGGVAGGVTFFPTAGGYKAGRGYHGSLERNEGSWDFYAKNGTRYHYSRRFRINLAPVTVLSPVYLEYIEDTNGNRTSLGYSPGGHRAPQLDFIRDSSGRQINLEYRAIQQLASIAAGGLNEDGSPIDPENIKPSAVNDLYGFPRNVITRVTGLGYDIAYAYDENGRLVEATNYQDRGNLSEEVSEVKSITEVYQYQ
ncbi:MAG: hypothetical protein JKX81_05125, partial [Arenicella sp.]|nr:hypothetical protein [Arenicella sp.]